MLGGLYEPPTVLDWTEADVGDYHADVGTTLMFFECSPLRGGTPWQRLALIGVLMLVFVVELLNTAIEKLCDRVSREIDPQIGWVKDMGSAAVGIMLLLAGAVWLLAIAQRLGLL